MRFRVLDESSIRDIHDTAVMMLASIGMDVRGDGPRRAFLEAGARENDGRILASEEVVEEALRHVPSNGFELVGRDPNRRCRVAPGNVHFRPAGGMPFTVDYSSETRRPATMTDAANMVQVVDALDGIDIANSAVSPADIGVGIRNVLRFANSVRNSTKPTDIAVSGPDEVAAIDEIARVIRPGCEALEREPLVLLYVAPTSPLRISEGEALAVIECARRRLPLGPLSCPTLAATAPATMAGGLAQQWAEELALIVLAQSVSPGLPIMACSRVNPVDMRRGSTIFSGVATGLMTAAFADLAAAYNLATNGWGFSSSSHAPDLQAGAERMAGGLLAALGGTSIVSGAGTLSNALIGTPEQLVIDNEIIGIIRDACRGVPVTPQTLARDVLAEGVRDGTFMATQHTVDHLRSGEMWMAELFCTEPYETWFEGGEQLIDRASARVREILRTHEVPPLEPAQDREVNAILKAAGV